MPENVTITVDEHERLLERDKWLSALEAAGVDNWSGYEHAQEMLEILENDEQ